MIEFNIKEYNLDELEYLKKTMQYAITTLCDGCGPDVSCLECKWYAISADTEVALFGIEQERLKRKDEKGG